MGRDSRFKVFDIEDGIMSSYILLCIFWAQKPAGDLFSFFSSCCGKQLMYAGRTVTPQIEGSTSNIEMGGERLSLCPETYAKSVRA